jgi:membrane-bound lytic murein transglycosylase D
VSILRELQRKVNKPSFQMSQLDPTEKRLVELTAHINHPQKYTRLANSLRSQRGQRDFIKKGIEMSSRYLPAIEEEFKEMGLPKELSYIAFVESSFNIRAVSKVGASGVYQFMPFVARPFLIIKDGIDERRDPIKSGLAAAKLFSYNHEIVGSWPLAVTSYNHGPFGVRKAVQKVGSNDIADLIEKYDSRSFGFASKNFYSEFLGILLTLQEKDKHFLDLQMSEPLAFESYKLPQATRIKTLKNKYNVTTEVIHDYNPDLAVYFIRSNGLLPKGYVFKVPASTSKDGLATEDKNPNSPTLVKSDTSI